MLLSDIPANLDIGLDPMNYFPVGDVAELTARLNADFADFQVDRDTVRARFRWDRAAADPLEVHRTAIAPRRLIAGTSTLPGAARGSAGVGLAAPGDGEGKSVSEGVHLGGSVHLRTKN